MKIEKVRRQYIGGKREEAALTGITGFIGSIYELTDYTKFSGADEKSKAYWRAHKIFYRRFPAHPLHPVWRVERNEQFMARVKAHDQEAVVCHHTYFKILCPAVDEWNAANPKSIPIHPGSVDWNPLWDLLKDDPDNIWPARHQFLIDNETDIRAAQGLWELLRTQLEAFMATHFKAIDYGDKRRRK